jgi:hypothetical protein
VTTHSKQETCVQLFDIPAPQTRKILLVSRVTRTWPPMSPTSSRLRQRNGLVSQALVSSGSGIVIQRLFLCFLWQRFSDVIHRHITAAELRYRYPRKPKRNRSKRIASIQNSRQSCTLRHLTSYGVYCLLGCDSL